MEKAQFIHRNPGVSSNEDPKELIVGVCARYQEVRDSQYV